MQTARRVSFGKQALGGLVLASLAVFADASGLVWGQPTESFGEQERVTAIDVVVAPWQGDSSLRKSPKDLKPEDFQLNVGGEDRRVVAIGPPSFGSLTESWNVLIYVDEVLSSTATVRWASDLLYQRAADLVRLGQVDLVIADEQPTYLLRGAREAGTLESSLARLAESERGRDELTALRSAFLTALQDDSGDDSPAELRAAFSAEEERLVRSRLDMLLTYLVDEAAMGSRKVLFLVSDGFDVDPDRFYSMWSRMKGEQSGREASEMASASESVSGVEDLLVATTRAVSAYGWITHPLVAPERPSPLVPGLRIGKWRVSGPAGGRIIGLRIVREHQREQQKAENLVELGLAQLEKAEADKAEESFRQALVHFAGDPRTAQSQAQAYLGLSEALTLQQEDQAAREALAQAAVLDPSIEEENPESVAALWEPLEPLRLLARESSGGLVANQDDLVASATGLGRRLRLTYQAVGAPPGEIQASSVAWSKSGTALASPSWTRFGTPEAVSASRARRLLEGDFADTRLELDLVLQAPQSAGSRTLLAAFEEPPDLEGWEEERLLRVTIATGAPEVKPRVTHHLLHGTENEPWPVFSGEVESVAPGSWSVVVMEDLATGHWAADVIELN